MNFKFSDLKANVLRAFDCQADCEVLFGRDVMLMEREREEGKTLSVWKVAISNSGVMVYYVSIESQVENRRWRRMFEYEEAWFLQLLHCAD